jgi:type I restriction enzyme M protein
VEGRISIFGQESNQTTWRLCKMNLAICGIDSSNVKWNNEGSFLNDLHKDLKMISILRNNSASSRRNWNSRWPKKRN